MRHMKDRLRRFSAMSVSNHWLGRMRDASWLGITNKPAALAYVTVLTSCVAIIYWAELYGASDALLRGERLPVGDAFFEDPITATSPEVSATVLILGGSTARELTSVNSYVSAQVSARCKMPVRVVNAASSGQNLAEAWAIADHWHDRALNAVLVGMNYYRLRVTRRALEAQAGALNVVPMLPSWRLQWRYFREFQEIPLLQLQRNLKLRQHLDDGSWYGSPPPVTDPDLFIGPRNYYRAPPQSDDWKRLRVAEFAALRGPEMVFARGEGAQLWTDFQRDLLSRGIAVTYLVLPLDPSMRPVDMLLRPVLDEALESFQASGATIVDWTDFPGLLSSDFFDQQHLLATGRRKIADGLHDLIAEVVLDCRP